MDTRSGYLTSDLFIYVLVAEISWSIATRTAGVSILLHRL